MEKCWRNRNGEGRTGRTKRERKKKREEKKVKKGLKNWASHVSRPRHAQLPVAAECAAQLFFHRDCAHTAGVATHCRGLHRERVRTLELGQLDLGFFELDQWPTLANSSKASST